MRILNFYENLANLNKDLNIWMNGYDKTAWKTNNKRKIQTGYFFLLLKSNVNERHSKEDRIHFKPYTQFTTVDKILVNKMWICAEKKKWKKLEKFE